MTAPTSLPPCPRLVGIRAAILLCCRAAVAVSGCGQEQIGNARWPPLLPGQSGSVNGTDVLADMFAETGHDVHFRRTLVTDEMEAADVVVWFPDNHHAPSDEVCEWFDQWLSESPDRTLVFVGRDFSAAPLYWEFLARQRQKNKTAKKPPAAAAESPPSPEADPKPKDEESASPKPTRDEARDEEEDKAESIEEEKRSPWFAYQEGKRLEIRQLAGPWAKGVDGAKSQIELDTVLVPSGQVDKLLTSGDKLLVSRMALPHWNGSQILLVANGSFLLNLPLVNHEHRKLAGKLIEATGEPGQVVFLESGKGGPPIDPPPVDSSIWTLFEGWPLGAILLQLAAAGVIFCFARWPIFGRPKQPPPESTADFAKHVTAVGQLMARTRDRQFALCASRARNRTALQTLSRPPSCELSTL